MAAVQNPNAGANLMKDFSDMTLEERLEFLDSFDIAFCDCDGVLWKPMQQKIPEIAQAIDFLRKHNKQIVYVTNNSLRNVNDLIQKFNDNGIQVTQEEIIRPAQAIAKYLKKLDFEGNCYVISNSPLREHLQSDGINVLHGPDRVVGETFDDLCKQIYDDATVKAVIIDIDFNLSISKMIKAHLYLKDPECILIGGAYDTTIPFGPSDIIGPGPFISVLEKTSNKKAKIFGKPGKELGEMLLDVCQDIPPHRVLFVGDSLESDIQFANRLGFQSLLVFTGFTKRQDLCAAVSDIDKAPHYVADTLLDIIIP